MEDRFRCDIISILNRESPGELETWLRQTLAGACGNFTFEQLDPFHKKQWTEFMDSQLKVESPFANRLLTLICQDKMKEIGSFFYGKPRLFKDFFFQNEQRIS